MRYLGLISIRRSRFLGCRGSSWFLEDVGVLLGLKISYLTLGGGFFLCLTDVNLIGELARGCSSKYIFCQIVDVDT